MDTMSIIRYLYLKTFPASHRSVGDQTSNLGLKISNLYSQIFKTLQLEGLLFLPLSKLLCQIIVNN